MTSRNAAHFTCNFDRNLSAKARAFSNFLFCHSQAPFALITLASLKAAVNKKGMIA